ncbi:NADP-dependent oxidoreductase domain-containing protein 1 [Ctenodactylus gundi]
MDELEDLKSLQFEYGISEEDRCWLYLLGRSRGLMIEAFAHAIFFCKLFCKLRELIYDYLRTKSLSTESPDLTTAGDEKLKVGIIGGGHLGKKLTWALLQLVPIPPESMRISTRRPETLGEFQKLHIPCFYNNPNLVKWADVVFLCCLPSQLPNICVEIQTSLKETSCTVYSFVAAVTLPRLKLLLNYSNILRPQYHCTMDFDNIWGANKDITDALQDPAILRATCPYSSAGGITLDTKWLEGVLYAAINVFTVNKVAHLQTLQLLNKFLVSMHSEDRKKDRASCLQLQLTDFVSAACARSMLPNKSFPWFDLTAVQVQETPFSRHLSTSTVLQEYLTHVYCDSFCISVTEEQPEVHTESPSQ